MRLGFRNNEPLNPQLTGNTAREMRGAGLPLARRASSGARWLLLLALGCRPQTAALGHPTTGRLAAESAAALSVHPTTSKPVTAAPRNVILLLADGTSPEAWTLARWVKGSALAVDGILTGAVRTYGADSIITDSAPGATAYATGYKGTDKALSVGAFRTNVEGVSSRPELAHRPLVTLLEAAKHHGYATGLVATSSIQHATPAAFSAHVADRNQYEEIAEQQSSQGIDVVLGGGLQYLLPQTTPAGKRVDGENLVDALKEQGYPLVTTREQLAATQSGRIWGIFGTDDLAYDCDRERFEPNQPSLAAMTEHALARLSASAQGKSQGFFLFVEGSKVDWAAHDNDPVGVVSELLAFDAAVSLALSFAKEQGNTQVLVVSDHATGGITIGTRADPSYSQTTLASVVTPLRKAKISANRLSQLLSGSPSANDLAAIIEREWALADLSKAELTELASAFKLHQSFIPNLSRIISTRARIGWTTGGHTGADVPLFAYGPDHPQGLVENTDVGKRIAQFMGLDLRHLQDILFIDLKQSLLARGFSVNIDRSSPNNGKATVSNGTKTAELYQSKNWVVANGRRLPFSGVVVFAEPRQTVFGPEQVITILERELR